MFSFLCLEDLKKASKLFLVLFLLNREINLQNIHTHPNSITKKEQTRQHLPPELVLPSFTWGLWFFLFCFPWLPAEVTLEFDPKSLTSVRTPLLTWGLVIEIGMSSKNCSSFSRNFFPQFLREVGEYFISRSSLKEKADSVCIYHNLFIVFDNIHSTNICFNLWLFSWSKLENLGNHLWV